MSYVADLKHLRTTLEKFEKIHSGAVVNGDHMDEILYKENIENVKHQIHIHEQAAKAGEYEAKAKAFDNLVDVAYWHFERIHSDGDNGLQYESFYKDIRDEFRKYESGESDE